VAEVRLSAIAVEDLERMILTHSLPADTKARVARSLEPLSHFPLLGRELEGRWSPFRFILGPWRWMLVLYIYDELEDVVLVVTIQDARSSSATTSG
jgi:plasmid stabilization system protein ParE